MKNSEKTLDMIVNLCKNRGFVYSGSEIYGGLANAWDYGPLGVEFKNNVKKAWLKKFVQESDYNVGLDAAILMNPTTWVTTGHVGNFSDPLVDCKGCGSRQRADKLIEENLAAVQTPQGFLFSRLLDAHKKAAEDGKNYTDDTEIWGKYCGKVKIVDGDSINKKITYPSDIPQQKPDVKKESKMLRTGLGYDLHKLVEGRKLMLGGIEIPFEKGEDGHSDGDVLLHALTDALLGASGMGDIGSFFPPEDQKWKDADSKMLLKTVWNKITEKGWKLENADCVIALEKPKFIPYRQKVIESIATILEVQSDQIFVKAKTGEKMGKIGRSEAIEVWATCLLSK